MNYPLLFEPVFMERIWGGQRLNKVLGKRLPSGAAIGESWEISDHGDHSSTVRNGPLRGLKLRDLLSRISSGPTGIQNPQKKAPNSGGTARFPLLVKWIDAGDKLSVQVHPPDGHHRLPPGESGKSECWLILDAEPSAEIYVGLRRGIDRPSLLRELSRGTVDRCLNAVSVRPGDFLYVPAGIPHAIGGGILLAEIQQTSDTTFRLFDWNRADATGQARPLHVESALECIDFEAATPEVKHVPLGNAPAGTTSLLGSEHCPYFSVAFRSMYECDTVGEPDRFHVIVCLWGRGQVHGGGFEVPIVQGDCMLLPPADSYEFLPGEHLELLDAWF